MSLEGVCRKNCAAIAIESFAAARFSCVQHIIPMHCNFPSEFIACCRESWMSVEGALDQRKLDDRVLSGAAGQFHTWEWSNNIKSLTTSSSLAHPGHSPLRQLDQ